MASGYYGIKTPLPYEISISTIHSSWSALSGTTGHLEQLILETPETSTRGKGSKKVFHIC